MHHKSSIGARRTVQGKLHSGEYKPGDLIPSENRLVQELDMSRMTVSWALRELTEEGHLVRISGIGTVMVESRPQSNLLPITNIADGDHLPESLLHAPRPAPGTRGSRCPWGPVRPHSREWLTRRVRTPPTW
ncbi:GntR family transcriptional regulator [Pseudomonas sp.]|uniref:GntR family transcriptional regulator n=1 Tax=Pseudomonas sp. TaxID=306 RepID=UPI002607083D|nr:GntR family transcriptional regulator [Pseudomonas sp.]